MLTRLIARGDVVVEAPTAYNAGVEYEYRDTEYEHKYDRDKLESSREPEYASRRY